MTEPIKVKGEIYNLSDLDNASIQVYDVAKPVTAEISLPPVQLDKIRENDEVWLKTKAKKGSEGLYLYHLPLKFWTEDIMYHIPAQEKCTCEKPEPSSTGFSKLWCKFCGKSLPKPKELSKQDNDGNPIWIKPPAQETCTCSDKEDDLNCPVCHPKLKEETCTCEKPDKLNRYQPGNCAFCGKPLPKPKE